MEGLSHSPGASQPPCSSSPIPFHGCPLQSYGRGWGEYGQLSETLYRGVSRESRPILFPKKMMVMIIVMGGAMVVVPLPRVLQLCITCCMQHVLAAKQSSASKASSGQRRPTEETKKDKKQERITNLEDKGGRGDRLSPVGILNHCGFNKKSRKTCIFDRFFDP